MIFCKVCDDCRDGYLFVTQMSAALSKSDKKLSVAFAYLVLIICTCYVCAS